MSDDGKRPGEPPATGHDASTDDDVDYWLRRARELKAAKKRRPAGDFRRDTGKPPRKP